MVEPAGGLGLLLEAAQALAIGGEALGQDLDRDLAVEARVLGSVDLTHAARPNGGKNLVRPEASAGRQQHGLQVGRNNTARVRGNRWVWSVFAFS